MSKIAIIYKSKYGTTKQYAEWIAEELNASLYEASSIKPQQLTDYETIIYGGGLYASGILGVKLVTQNPCKYLVVFTVGIADSQDTDYTEILTKNFKPEQLSQTKIFHLRGGIDYSKLNLAHKGMMAMMKKHIEKKPVTERSSEDKGILETYGTKVDFTDRSTIEPIAQYVRALK
jgi:menaquinone-dependent protoporphyrinogen IX oxidase